MWLKSRREAGDLGYPTQGYLTGMETLEGFE